MENLDYEAWRCCKDDAKFCPTEGCPKHLGCARERGWKPDQPSPYTAAGIMADHAAE